MPRGRLKSSIETEEKSREILAEKIQERGNVIQRTRSFKNHVNDGPRSKGRVSPEERAEMMMTILEDPNITTKEFGLKHGYQGDPAEHVSSSAYAMMTTLKEELSKYVTPDMEDLLKADLLILGNGLKEQFRRLKEEPDSMNMNEITNALSQSFRRVRLLQGKSTSNTKIQVDEVDDMDESTIDAYLKDAIRIELIDKRDKDEEALGVER